MSMHMLSQLARIELLTPRLEESVNFFVNILGLDEAGRDEKSVYLRCWGDNFHHSIQLTAGEKPALGCIGWRADGEDGLTEAVARLETAEAGEGWNRKSVGRGPVFRYRGPGGHLQEVFWDVERHKASAESRSTFPSRPQRRASRGCALRQLDHVTVALPGDPLEAAKWYRDTLGYRFMEYTVLDGSDDCFFAMVSVNDRAHDLGLLRDTSGMSGRIHHIAFWLDEPAHVYEAAEFLVEAGHAVEFGPGRHGMGEEVYLYVRDPGGMRIEFMSGGRRNYEPDWPTVKWAPRQGSIDFYRNATPPASLIDSFPPAEGGVINPWAAKSVR
jgi:catechol 2,3-dioxygenase